MLQTNVPQGTQGLGWFLRRTRDPIASSKFYEEGLGLPRLRSWDVPESTGVMLWCGEVGVFELNRISEDVPYSPGDTPCMPIFKTLDLEASTARAVDAGATLVDKSEDERAVLHTFTDPDGFRFGIEHVVNPIYETDQFVERQREMGLMSLPGEIVVDGPIECISRVQHEAKDPEVELAFLEAMGFKRVNGNGISLGGGCYIEVIPTDRELQPMAERSMSFDTWIARVYGLDTFRTLLEKTDGKMISRHEFKGGTLDYALTPHNVLVGWQERNAYDPDLPTTQMIEDLNARTRWMRGFS